MQPLRRKITCSWPFVAVVALLVMLLAQPALADKYWVGPNPNNYWTNANNWSNTSGGPPGAGQPGAGENVFLTQSDAINRTVLFNTGLNPLLNSLTVDATGSGTITLQKYTNTLRAQNEIIGDTGTGHFIHGSGSNAISQRLIVGFHQGSLGTYDLKSGSLSAMVTETIGQDGTGTFTQSSGENNLLRGTLAVGNGLTGSGTYNLKSGKLSALNEFIGSEGMGTFNQYSSSINTVGDTFALAVQSSGMGTYNLYSGNLSVLGQFDVIGARGTGIFNHWAGTHTVASSLVLGGSSSGMGTYNFYSGTLSVAGDEAIAIFGTGIFNHFGGINKVTGTLILAQEAGSSGTYNYLGGTLSTGGGIEIGAGGTFNITGISPTISGNVFNNGTVKTTNANVTWSGTFTNDGAYISDPSTQTFKQNLKVGSPGYIVATHSQDLFIFKEDFINNSTNSANWNTAQAALKFITGTDTSHIFAIAGDGSTAGHPFAWYSLNITGQTLHLQDGDAAANGAQWLEALIGAKFTGTTLTNIVNDDGTNMLNLYYDKNLAANAYLGGLNYTITGGAGGMLIAHTPLPPSVLLLGSGLLGMGLLGWRRKRLKG